MLAGVLRFSLADIPVGVHFSFLIIAIFGPDPTLAGRAIWVVAAFVAVLLHEAGHAFTARHYGATPVRITLFAMGGVTVYPATEDLTPGRRFVIAAAGSAVGIVTGGALLLATLSDLIVAGNKAVEILLVSYIWASLGWGVLNWIPIRPLDGGAMMTSALEIVSPRHGVAIARYVSLFLGATIAALLYTRLNEPFLALFVLFITAAGFGDRSDDPQRRAAGTVDDDVPREAGPDPSPADPSSHDEPDTSFPI